MFDEGGFAGQAMMADVVPDDSRMLAYAVDLDLRVAVTSESEPKRVVSAVSRQRARDVVAQRPHHRCGSSRAATGSASWSWSTRSARLHGGVPEGPVETGDAWRFGVEIGAAPRSTRTVPRTWLRGQRRAC